MDYLDKRRTTNIQKIRLLFLEGKLDCATNSEILRLSSIKPHQQVFQITKRLEAEGFLRSERRGREKLFYLSNSMGRAIFKDADSSSMGGADVTRNARIPSVDANSGSQFLKELGFEHAGCAKLGPNGLDFDISQHSASLNILYAFISGEQVLYIGITSRSFRERMNNYKNPGPSQSTNLGNKARIEQLLGSGVEVDILVFSSQVRIIYRSVAINLSAGLERPLISLLRPPWNLLVSS